MTGSSPRRAFQCRLGPPARRGCVVGSTTAGGSRPGQRVREAPEGAQSNEVIAYILDRMRADPRLRTFLGVRRHGREVAVWPNEFSNHEEAEAAITAWDRRLQRRTAPPGPRRPHPGRGAGRRINAIGSLSCHPAGGGRHACLRDHGGPIFA